MENTDACARIVPLLPALLDGGISAGEIREVESHLAVCPSCAAERAAIARTLRIVAGRSRPELDPACFDAMRRNLRSKLVAAPAPRRLPRFVWQGGLAFEKFTGRKAPFEIMKQAAAKALAHEK